jgi:hypothetical protein
MEIVQPGRARSARAGTCSVTRAAALRCLLPGTSQAIGKRLSGRLNDTSVAPEFTPKRNFELSDNRDRRPHDAVRLEIGE